MNVPGYALRDLLAKSASSALTRAVRLSDGLPVVLKSVPGPIPTVDARRRLLFEYELLSKLSSPGVIRPVAWVDSGLHPVLVLEDFGGADLASNGDRRLPLNVFFDVAVRLVRAIGDVHAQGVIHKDIKPSNIIRNPSTGVVKLIDFHLSTELSREQQDTVVPEQFAGSFPYASPEQTGRMNRRLDYRTDYYSLGVTLFELLTGQLPLQAADPIGWFHAHMSKQPLAADNVSDAPGALARLLDKLLAKDPDARYQSAQGLLLDLELCSKHYQTRGAIPGLVLGQRDTPERFQVSDRLIGRQQEVGRLVAMLERARVDRGQLLLISGPSGIGKSSLIGELHRPVASLRGALVRGKFDQLERAVPYGAFRQAIAQLVRYSLGQPESALDADRARILAALGSNAQVLIDLVPELEKLIGAQPPAPSLNPTEAQHRFRRVLCDFLGACARPEHPLVLFLDDLQWCDSSTPDLIVDILLEPRVRHLLIIGAYRDSEVSEGHLLSLALRRIRAQRPSGLAELSVGPLSLAAVTEICADCLRIQPDESLELGHLVFDKTAGNPFFVSELLADLHRSGAIRRADGGWQVDLAQARLAAARDNVVDLLLDRLAALPEATRRALGVAACLGNQFQLSIVARLCGDSPSATSDSFWSAAQSGLICPVGDGYRLARINDNELRAAIYEQVTYQFLHDRVQQAAHSLIDSNERSLMHLNIGRHLREQGEAQSKLFEVVNHLNLGRCHIHSDRELGELRSLNERAGIQAMAATAYAIASAYFDRAVELADALGNAVSQEERFELLMLRAKSTLGAGNASAASEQCEALGELAPNRVSQGAVYLLRARIQEAQAQFSAAVDAARQGLRLFEIDLPADPAAIDQGIGAGIGQMQQYLGAHPPEDLLNLPELTDPGELMATHLLVQTIPAAIQTHPPLFILIELILFRIATTRGISSFSAKNFVDCGIIEGGILGNYPIAYRLGKVAFGILERFNARPLASGVNFVFATYVSSWRAAPAEALSALQESYRAGAETGDVQHMGFATALRMHRLLHVGQHLDEVREELTEAIAFLERERLPSQRTAVVLVEQALARLCNPSATVEALAEMEAEATQRVQDSRNPQWIYAYAEAQMIVSLVLGELESAERWRSMAEPYVPAAIALTSVPEFHLGEVLIWTAKWQLLDEAERARVRSEISQREAKLKVWSENCPENFAHKYHLLCAERARIDQAPLSEIIDHYEAAAASTGDSFAHMRALALELQSRFWRERAGGNEQHLLAQALLNEALTLYQGWGARRKVQLLQRKSAIEVSEPQRLSVRTAPSQSVGGSRLGIAREQVDLASVLKVSQALSSEVHADRLSDVLMSALLENAAAERGSLILKSGPGSELRVVAQASVSASICHSDVLLDEASELCPKIAHIALRSAEPFVVDDASAHPEFRDHPYIHSNRIRSVLCIPIIQQGRVLGAFYAENNQIKSAFSAHRVATLGLIAGQAAISLVNAELYANLEARVTERTRQLATKSREIVAMLDSMEQGIFSIDADLKIGAQYSRRLPELLGKSDLSGRPFEPLLFDGSSVGQDARSACEMALRFSFGVPPAVAAANADHLIREFRRGEGASARYFEILWNPIVGNDGLIERLLVVLRDVTLLKRLHEAQRRSDYEANVTTQVLAAGVDAFLSLCEGTQALLTSLRGLPSGALESSDLVGSVFREMHTLKGTARSLGLVHLVDLYHAAETILSGQAAPLIDAVQLQSQLDRLQVAVEEHEEIARRRLGSLWPTESERLRRAIGQIESALNHARAQGPMPAPTLAVFQSIEQSVRQAQAIPLRQVWEEATKAVPAWAADLGKPMPELICQDEGIAVSAEWARLVRDTLVHLLPNALDHGIEPSIERTAAGKSPAGRITFHAERQGDELILRLNDDGRGLALDRLRQRQEHPNASDAQLAELIFESGVSTSADVTHLSGRGVGMDAVRTFLAKKGASVQVQFTAEERTGYRPFQLVLALPPGAAVLH